MEWTIKNRKRRLAGERSFVFNVLVLCTMATLLLNPCLCQSGQAEGNVSREYRIKAAFIYKFLRLVKREDSAASSPAGKKKVTIAIVGRDPFGKAFEQVEGARIKPWDAVLNIRRFNSISEMLNNNGGEDCWIAYLRFQDQTRIKEELAHLADTPILTVSDTDGFLQAGGMINLVVAGNKIRWAINRRAARAAGLEISSQLLRNAVRVIEPGQ